MRIHISDREKYKFKDPYAKKMKYTTTIFGGDKKLFNEVRNNAHIKSKYVVWYSR